MSRLDISKIYSPIASRLEAVEAELQNLVKSEVPVVRRLAEHVSKGSAKRLRPALVLMASNYCGCTTNEDIRFGAIFEMLHTATLIHDDVIDHASTRRGHPSLNATWGNAKSVLFGDFLYLQTMRSALTSRNWRMMELLIDIGKRMIEGELMQNECLYNLETSSETYFEILERKTALLFAGCTECGAILADKEADVCQRLNKFGLELGRAFQLVDDLLDYIATSDHLGKPAFSDLREGKLTLPILLLLERARNETMPIIKRVWANDSAPISLEDAKTLRGLLKQHEVQDEIRRLAHRSSMAACEALPLENGKPEIAGLLKEIPEILLERTH